MDGMRLPLNISFAATRPQEWITVLVEITDFAGEILETVLSQHAAQSEPVVDAGGGLAVRRIDASVPVKAVSCCGSDFP